MFTSIRIYLIVFKQTFKSDHDTKNNIDRSAMGTLILFFITIQVVLVINLYRSYQKIKKLDMEEREFQEYVENFGYDLDEYDDD
jgi:hypothetical protein